MNTGKLNRRISYTPSGTFIDDGIGGKTQTVAGVAVETWCSARQLSMRELISYGLPVDNRTFEFGFIYLVIVWYNYNEYLEVALTHPSMMFDKKNAKKTMREKSYWVIQF